jgi:hypothetical protein
VPDDEMGLQEMQTKEFLTRFADAFKCLEEAGLSRRRLRVTAHEYEVWYSSQRYAVRLTLERQWSYEYLFVQFFQRSERGEWEPLFYLNRWLKSQGWEETQIETLLKASEPVPNLPEEAQEAFWRRVAAIVCTCMRQVVGL